MSSPRIEAGERSQLRLAGPLYDQVAGHLQHRIRSNEWTEGQSLPNEFDLAAEYGVSLGTIRKSLEILARRRILVRHQGRGTFISPMGNANPTASWVFGFDTAEEKAGAVRATTVIRSVDRIFPTAHQSQILGVTPEAACAEISCVTSIGDNVVSSDSCIAVLASYPHLRKYIGGGPNKFSGVIEPVIATAHHATDLVRPDAASEDHAGILGIDTGSLILCIERHVFELNGKPVCIIGRNISPTMKVGYTTSFT